MLCVLVQVDEYLEFHNCRTSLHRYFGTTVMCYLRFVKGRTIEQELAASDKKPIDDFATFKI